MNDTSRDRIIAEARHLQLVDRGGWEFVQRRVGRGVALIVPVTDAGELVLIEQYRPALERTVIEFPAGLVGDDVADSNERTVDAAQRELREETGFRASEWQEVGAGPSSPGLSDEVITVFVARGLEQVGPGGGDGSETIEVRIVAMSEIRPWLEQRQREGLAVDLKVLMVLALVSGA